MRGRKNRRIRVREIGTTIVAGGLLGLAWTQFGGAPDRAAAAAPLVQRSFGTCAGRTRINCVVDGDTFWMDGEKIRIADIDTPETHPSRCASEADLGGRATVRLRILLNDGPFALESIARDSDRYGRKLRRVTRNGVSIGDMLVAEGLARPYGRGRQPWCGV